MQEEQSELGLRIKSDRFRWYNCSWLEIVTGESLYEEEEEEDEDYLDHYFLHSATELDNPDYFYSMPDSPSRPMDEVDHEGYPLSSQQHYDTSGPMDGGYTYPFAGYDAGGLLPPQNSPFPSTYEEDLRMNAMGTRMKFNSDPRASSSKHHTATNPLASPGMLFEREQDIDEEPSQYYSARQLMPAMEDPLALYSANFNASEDLDRDLDYADSVQEGIEFSHTYTSTEYPAGFAAVGRRVSEQKFHGFTSGGF